MTKADIVYLTATMSESWQWYNKEESNRLWKDTNPWNKAFLINVLQSNYYYTLVYLHMLICKVLLLVSNI